MKNQKVLVDVIVYQRGFFWGGGQIKYQQIILILSEISFKLS